MIDILREHPLALEWHDSLEESPAVSCFTVLELLGGSKNKAEFQLVEKLLMDFPVRAGVSRASKPCKRTYNYDTHN
jgi:predicted nucleic acid-binding protein